MAVDVHIPEIDAIQDDGSVLLNERTSHTAGGHWRVHKADADDVWPSDFHAHNVNDDREKLDVYTGVVYNKTTKEELYKIKPKVMRYIYRDMKSSKEKAISDKCDGDKKKFTYLE